MALITQCVRQLIGHVSEPFEYFRLIHYEKYSMSVDDVGAPLRTRGHSSPSPPIFFFGEKLIVSIESSVFL